MATTLDIKYTRVWRRSMDLAIAVNRVMRAFPEKERNFGGLCTQLLEAVIRIPSRVAESHEPYFRDPVELLQQAHFHLTETQSLLELSGCLGYLSGSEQARLNESCREVKELIEQQIYNKRRAVITA